MSAPPLLSGPYAECARLLVRLHDFIRRGEGDSAEADEFRDKMDGLWGKLSPHESDRIRELSADLNLVGRPSPRDIPDVDTGLRQGVREAEDARDWGRILILLRENAACLASHELAYAFGRCWVGLGDLESGLVFLKEAVELVPEVLHYRIQVLATMVKLDRVEEAASYMVELAEEADPIIPLHRIAHGTVIAEDGGPTSSSRGRRMGAG